ncbi:MAG: hypothetical protein IPJ97_08475 [Proteobacteria bacterium]|nr:hypothetical protein [Pseudomonadota bacterium]
MGEEARVDLWRTQPEARLYIEAIAKAEHIDINIVPLQSGGEMINALLGKQVMLAFSGGIHCRYPDELKTVSALTTFRHPSAPDVLTIEEEGYPFAMDFRTTVYLPKGAPRLILDKLSKALKAAASDKDFKKVAASADVPIEYLGVDAAFREMAKTYDKNKLVIKGMRAQLSQFCYLPRPLASLRHPRSAHGQHFPRI